MLNKLPARITIALIRVYQCTLSVWLTPSCRFHPSCSCYAIEALEKRGFVVGFFLASWRILRCNPWCYGGVDLVPESKSTSIKPHASLNRR